MSESRAPLAKGGGQLPWGLSPARLCSLVEFTSLLKCPRLVSSRRVPGEGHGESFMQRADTGHVLPGDRRAPWHLPSQVSRVGLSEPGSVHIFPVDLLLLPKV